MIPYLLKTSSWALRIGCAVHYLHDHIYEFSETHGESMLPTLYFAGDFVHSDKTCQRGRGCRVGDVVVALKPTDTTQRVCKRISGMPGDYIMVDPAAGKQDFIKVPEGHCWLTGDNLSQSLDSRSYGVVPLALIKGRIFAAHNIKTGEMRWIENNLA